MKKIFFIIILFAQVLHLYGEIERSARYLGTGGVSVTIKDVSAVFYNVACIENVKKYAIDISFMPVYSVENFYYTKFAGVVRLNKFNISLAGNRVWLGSLFSGNNFYFGAAYKLSSKVSFGSAIKYGLYTVEKSPEEINNINNSISYLTLELGAEVRIIKYLELGIAGKNLTNPKITFLKESTISQSTRNFIIGGKINFTDYFYISVDEKFYNNERELKAGSELWVYNTVAVRIGINDKEQYSMGIGLKTGFINFDLGVQSHPYLGNLYQIDVILRN